MDAFGLGEGFYCETCGGYGGLQIGNTIHLELTCPTCHGESRGMPIEQFMDELAEDSRLNRDFRDEL